jgi:integrase
LERVAGFSIEGPNQLAAVRLCKRDRLKAIDAAKQLNLAFLNRMNDSAWRKARIRAGKVWQEKFLRPALPGFVSIRVHDLKHTFGRRLRAAGVTLEDRRALLGHKNGSVTSHYSTAELGQLIEAANKASSTDSRGPALTILRRKTG